MGYALNFFLLMANPAWWNLNVSPSVRESPSLLLRVYGIVCEYIAQIVVNAIARYTEIFVNNIGHSCKQNVPLEINFNQSFTFMCFFIHSRIFYFYDFYIQSI